MLATARLIRHELTRVLLSRRWLLVVLVCGAVAYLASDNVMAEVRNTGVASSAWDVHATAVNSLMYVGYLLFTVFAFVVGDTLVGDCDSGYGWMVVGRAEGRLGWWWAKLAAVSFSAVLVQLVLLVACLVAGCARLGLPVSVGASELAAVPAFQHGIALFPEVAAGSNMLLRQVLRSGYLALAFSALAIALVALTVRLRRGWLPMTAALLGLMADYVFVRAWEPWRAVSPGARLLEGAHSGWAVGELSWSSSLLYFGAMLLLAAVLGGRALVKADL